MSSIPALDIHTTGPTVRRFSPAAALGVAALLTAAFCCGQSIGPSSANEIASASISRGAVAPDFGHAFGYGYYTYINGVSGPMFSGPPSEATAYFTFRTTVATTAVLEQNIDITPVLSSGASYNIYFNANPAANFANPDTFSSGLLVATFVRTGFILTQVGFVGYETFNSVLTYSQPFSFNGQTINFASLTPALRTSNRFGRLAFPSGLQDYPMWLSFTGSAVATQLPSTERYQGRCRTAGRHSFHKNISAGRDCIHQLQRRASGVYLVGCARIAGGNYLKRLYGHSNRYVHCAGSLRL